MRAAAREPEPGNDGVLLAEGNKVFYAEHDAHSTCPCTFSSRAPLVHACPCACLTERYCNNLNCLTEYDHITKPCLT